MNRYDIEAEIGIHNEIMRQHESKLMADHLKRIDKLTRRGLLVFLDLESSRQNTKTLLRKARKIAINASSSMVDRDLTNAENCQNVNKHGFLVRP